MLKRSFIRRLILIPALVLGLFCMLCASPAFGQGKEIAPGVSMVTAGLPDRFTPLTFFQENRSIEELNQMPSGKMPFSSTDINITINERGTVVEIPLEDSEQIYGLGMQIGSFNQRGLRKRPIVNDNPLNDLGYTHGPTTFYVSNKGYGILINTARYTTFYCGTTDKRNVSSRSENTEASPQKDRDGSPVEQLYQNKAKSSGYITVDIPGAKGIEVLIFEGPDLRSAVQRYNLFSGGGALPAIWGLGVKYRVKADFTQAQVGKMAAYFRNNHIPCDVLGLEPKWQTAAYSCSYVWNKDFFPTPNAFTDSMRQKGFHLNLWEHAFISAKSPLYDQLKEKAGDYLVWNGLVPDFADSSARNTFAAYHRSTFVENGISGFKLDECDNSNIATGNSTWSFPELSTFPSGISGEQMHQLFGLLYQKTIYSIFRKENKRTYLDVRASNDFASSYPVALYSDTYDHEEYIRMILTSGFSGMLWSPEVRESNSIADFIRRSQTAVLSAQTLFNSWYLKNPPWLQINTEKNNRDELMPDSKAVEASIRRLLEFRMSLIPYLYNAFADYHFKGIPPFRALVMDYPDDRNTFNLSDEYMIGEAILAAPLTGDKMERKVYLPAGSWYDFNTHQKYEGGKTYTLNLSLEQLPVFVKEGSIIPLAKPLEFIAGNYQFEINCYVFGAGKATGHLFADDGYTYNYEKGNYADVSLSWESNHEKISQVGSFKQKRFLIKKWTVVR